MGRCRRSDGRSTVPFRACCRGYAPFFHSELIPTMIAMMSFFEGKLSFNYDREESPEGWTRALQKLPLLVVGLQVEDD
jgi:hypothetical protein